jgi:DNA-binding beta-propeller fold protein YncE
MFAVCKTSATLVVADLTRHRVIASLPVGGGPDSVAYDPRLRRIYATGKSGVLTVVQQAGADSYQIMGNVHLHYGAHTLAFDPATGRLYVGYASLLVPPRLAVFDTAAESAFR